MSLRPDSSQTLVSKKSAQTLSESRSCPQTDWSSSVRIAAYHDPEIHHSGRLHPSFRSPGLAVEAGTVHVTYEGDGLKPCNYTAITM